MALALAVPGLQGLPGQIAGAMMLEIALYGPSHKLLPGWRNRAGIRGGGDWGAMCAGAIGGQAACLADQRTAQDILV